MSEKVQHYTKIVFGLERSLPANLVVPKLKSMVESFKVYFLLHSYIIHSSSIFKTYVLFKNTFMLHN
jgi:hypothetical protein